jgi:hypothetical protein
MASSRRAHQVFVKGLPSVGKRAPSPHISTSVKSIHDQEGGTTSFNCRLPPQEGATSPRGAHLSMPTCSYLKRYPFNQVPITWILSPLTI